MSTHITHPYPYMHRCGSGCSAEVPSAACRCEVHADVRQMAIEMAALDGGRHGGRHAKDRYELQAKRMPQLIASECRNRPGGAEA
mmetsp:Transcript_66191/g.107360  ORF Transcript_66191/g.107360 Transcript_66191/m.107360 type:complete len:85 (-) Transcript_66191:386-640(-)